MSRDDYAQQGKQFLNDLRETASKKIADNEETIRGTVGKAARWVDDKTGGKYSEQIGKAEAKVGEGVGWAAKQGSESGGTPSAPGASAGEGTDAPTGPTRPAPPPTPPAAPPPNPTAGGPAGPGASAGPGSRPPSSDRSHDDGADWPRPPQG